LEESIRTALRGYFEHASAYLINHGGRPRNDSTIRDQELSARWRVQLAIDEAIAAIRARDADRAIHLVTHIDVDDAVRSGLLGAMLHAYNEQLTAYVHGEVRRASPLVHALYNGRTLLNTAAALGHVATVKVLLEYGADPNAGVHPALYNVANQCLHEGGGEIVRLLVAAGARVNACDNVKRCTALHMAARRDNVAVATALLDCGADIEARDSARETPLRRAVNTNMAAVAALLVARGADVDSIGSKGLTPLKASRSDAMRRALGSR
jgi:ankyrin repeat protein